MKKIATSELILNADGSVYHLHLLPEQLADTVLVVGDPGRVEKVSKHFDSVELRVQNREIITHTGWVGKKRITVLSSGMGTDNMDIVLNELDALVNVDLKERTPKKELKQLTIIRMGTSGGFQPDLPSDSLVASSHGIGMDGLLYFYERYPEIIDKGLTDAFIAHTNWPDLLPTPYAVAADPELLALIGKDINIAATCTASGFYAPQGRQIRMVPSLAGINEKLTSFRYGDLRIGNLEMETSALYGLGGLLGHKALTVCAIVANRYLKTFTTNYPTTMERLILHVLDRIS
jgi:uridine phosphorylase